MKLTKKGQIVPKIQQIPLEEEEYIQDISNIIKRDFFPDLVDGEQAPPVGLDQYQQKFTSEDNSSFQNVVELENERKRIKLQPFFNKDQPKIEWSSTRNALMYGPEGIPTETSNTKKLVHNATRIDSEVLTMLASRPSLLKSDKKREYELVPATPNLAPYKDVDPGELMTWGVVEGTPLLMDDDNRFSIAPTPKREELSYKLAMDAGKKIKNRKLLQSQSTKLVRRTPNTKTPNIIDRIRAKTPLLFVQKTEDQQLRNSYRRSQQQPSRTPQINKEHDEHLTDNLI